MIGYKYITLPKFPLQIPPQHQRMGMCLILSRIYQRDEFLVFLGFHKCINPIICFQLGSILFLKFRP